VRTMRELDRDGAEAAAAARLAAVFKRCGQHTSWLRLCGGMQVRPRYASCASCVWRRSRVFCSGGG
jgi:secreted trypsin-like serine protease